MSCSHAGCTNCRELEAQVQWNETLWALRASEILTLVTRAYHLEHFDLTGPLRTAHIASARQIACYLLRRLTGYSYPMIGEILHRDHSTIIHAYNVVAKQMAMMPERKRVIDAMAYAIEHPAEQQRQVAV